MDTKKAAQIIRTDKWVLNPTSQQRVLLGETVKIYRRLCRYLVGIVFTHWPELGSLSSEKLVPAVKRLIHRELAAGISDEQLAKLVTFLRERDTLCVINPEQRRDGVQIIGSMGIFSRNSKKAKGAKHDGHAG